jgi:hypothetical protein
MENLQPADPWKSTLDLLTQMSAPAGLDDSQPRLPHGKEAPFLTLTHQRNLASRESIVHLHIIEKSSDSAIVVCWRDSTSGCYGEQLWKRIVSRTRATCALSGSQIRRGDAVFRPWARGCKPVNVGLMILASAVAIPAE